MNSVASQHSQSQSLLNTSTISGPAGIADHNPGASSTSISNQQAFQGSTTPTNDTNLSSDNPKEQPPGDIEGEVHGQIEPVVIKEEGEVLLGTVNGQIELLEHTPEASVGSGDADVMVNEDAQDWIPDADHELKRVKVYELIGSRWMDQGTAFCFGQFQEETNEALLIARSERNYHDIVLSTAIRSNDVYQRQQDTLIVWTEPDGVDYALSFQDPEGCAEVWNFILEVQRHMNNSDDQGNLPSSPHLGPMTSANIVNSGYLPPPQLGIISEIERAIKTLARTQVVKERICDYIQHEVSPNSIYFGSQFSWTPSFLTLVDLLKYIRSVSTVLNVLYVP